MQKDKSAPIVIAQFIREALTALRPATRMTVSQWADANRILDSKTSSIPGRWRTGFTEYLRDIMDSFTDPETEQIVIVKPSQVGGSEAILNMIGYVIDNDPSATLVVYPDEGLGESISQNRIQPMVMLVPSLKNKFDQNSKRLELQFSGMYLAIEGANSPAGLSSRSCRYVFMDEVDKYPTSSGKEANPKKLAIERTKTFDHDKKIVMISTPTLDSGAIWKEYQAADTQYNYFVQCPHCGEEWTFKFKQLKFDSSSPSRAQETAVYICEECGAAIGDTEKTDMVKHGRWQAVRQGGKKTVAYHFNTFLSPWVRLGAIAAEFISSKDSPEDSMNFINSWLAEPYVEVETTMSTEYILKHRQSIYKRLEVPKNTVMLTGGVDVQRKCFYYVIRAWQSNMTSYNIAHGKVYTWQEIEFVFNEQYYDRTGKPYIVNLCAVDSGDQSDDVYDFCAINKEWTVPIKGSSTKLQGRYKKSIINRDGFSGGILLHVLDTDHYKSSIYDRLRRDSDNGGWYVHEDCDPEYAQMITSEHKIIEKVRGKLVSRWKQKQSGGDNHYLDCEVYAAAAADICGIRTIFAERYRKKQAPTPEPIAVQTVPSGGSGGFFAGASKGFLQTGKGGYFG